MRYFLFFCFIVFSSSVFAKLAVYDFHFHVNPESTVDRLDMALQNNDNFFTRKFTLLIDQAYSIEISSSNVGRDLSPFEVHQHLSQLIQDSEYPALGLCGANLKNPNVLRHVNDCLNLPGMIGVKLHLQPSGTMLSKCKGCLPGFVENLAGTLDELAGLVAKHRGVFLIHFAHLAHFQIPQPVGAFGANSFQEDAEAEAFFNVALNNPMATFIIAHSGTNSMVNPKALLRFGNHYKRNPSVKRNIYVETSVIVGHAAKLGVCFVKGLFEVMSSTQKTIHAIEDEHFCQENVKTYSHSEESSQVINAWRTFGLDRVIFGSDGPAEALVLESIQYLKTNPYLSEKEKQQIFYGNGKTLADRLLSASQERDEGA